MQQPLTRDKEQRVYFCEGIFIIFIKYLFLRNINCWQNVLKIRAVSKEYFLSRPHPADEANFTPNGVFSRNFLL